MSASYNPSVTDPGGEDCRRYSIVGDPTLPSGERSIDRWFNTDAFQPISLSNVQDVGNACDAWQYRLPGWNHHDLTLFKDFRLKGNQTLQYRWEIFNLFNTVEFQTVNQSATFNINTGAQTSSTFGAVTAARTERRMQMSLRYTF